MTFKLFSSAAYYFAFAFYSVYVKVPKYHKVFYRFNIYSSCRIHQGACEDI